MHLKILGSAAGGGFPQWNCACPNCRAVRAGLFSGKRRLQTQIAVSGDDTSWFLLGASPDLRAQIESTAELQPHSRTRNSPIAGVVLASADLDHVLGLLLLREMHPFQVWASSPVTETVRHENAMFRMLNRIENQVCWKTISSGQEFSLESVYGAKGRITCRTIPLSCQLPAYAVNSGHSAAASNEAVVGLVLKSDSGKTLGFFPQLPQLTPELKSLFATLDCLLLDGTFWSDDELIQLQGSSQSAHDMGHIPVGGKYGTLCQLADISKPRKMYIHINNTNPMLNEAGAEYRAVRDAGWELAEDGCHLSL